MENFVEIKTEKTLGTTEIRVDNGTSFKDFIINHNEDGKHTQISFQIQEDEGVLEINGVDLSKTELLLLKEFLKQID